MPDTKIPHQLANIIQRWQSLLRPIENIAIVGGLVIDKAGTILCAQGNAGSGLEIKAGLHLEKVLPDLWPKVAATRRDLKRRLEPSPSAAPGTDCVVWLEPIIQDSACDDIFCFFLHYSDIQGILHQWDAFQHLTRELNAIIDSSADGLWVCDAKGTVIRVNPASERICGVKARDVIGRNTQELIAQGLIERSVFEEVITSKRVVSQLTRRSNGSKFIATGTPVLDASGDVIRVVVSERDVTEIDRLQRELEEQAAIKDRYRHKIAEMQQAKLKTRQVIAKSPCMLKALSQAMRVSEVDSAVLILGESGVGKELVADLIHQHSSRAAKPMIKINCGAIPASLIEAELFGYEKGAFTGAHTRKPGQLELADGGVLFLDEVAELPPAAQVKLLRFLEDGQIMRVGGTAAHTVDVRVLSATHGDMERLVEQGRFRQDLYYRLNVIPLHVPPLRERKECILPLIRHYLAHYTKKTGYRKHLSLAATDALLAYAFPGNVRQLMNICERLVVMSETELIDLQDLPGDIGGAGKARADAAVQLDDEMPLAKALEKVEKSILERAYEKYRNQYKVAALLGVTQATIARKLKKYGIKKYADLE
jgi:PAS domain S-box-containing protein/TyrR family helix-turn-helix protein